MFPFFKYHGLGNDFLILERSGLGEQELTDLMVQKLCCRHRGVGADGILLVDLLPSGDLSPPRVRMVIFNRDGSRPQMCGNGVRCVVAYAAKRWGVAGPMIVESDAGPRRCEWEALAPDEFEVAVEMGPISVGEKRENFPVGELSYPFWRVDVGNPHAVVFEMPALEAIDRAGESANRQKEIFPEGVNVEFVSPQKGELRVVVFERGVGRTQACGTGACAVAAAAWKAGLVSPGTPVRVVLPGGGLEIEEREEQIWMKGPAEEVFEGVWKPN